MASGCMVNVARSGNERLACRPLLALDLLVRRMPDIVDGDGQVATGGKRNAPSALTESLRWNFLTGDTVDLLPWPINQSSLSM